MHYSSSNVRCNLCLAYQLLLLIKVLFVDVVYSARKKVYVALLYLVPKFPLHNGTSILLLYSLLEFIKSMVDSVHVEQLILLK